MPKTFLGLLAGGLLLIAAAPAAAAPVTVNLRIEGPTATLFEAPINTDVGPFHFTAGSDTADHTCDGQAPFGSASSAVPTRGAAITAAPIVSTGTWSSFGPSFSTINGVSVAYDAVTSRFLAEYKNWQFASVGACGDQIANGDDVLFAYADGSEPLLKLSAPATAVPGGSTTLTVTDGGTGAPVAGATVGGATTDGNGHAVVSSLPSGASEFKATKTGAIRSNTAKICATNGNDGLCGSPPCKTNGKDGLCGTTDTTKPAIEIASLKNDQVFRKKGPREFKGAVTETSGVSRVRIRLTRIVGKDTKTRKKSCTTFSSSKARFVKAKKCGAKHGTLFEIGKNPNWSYLLPSNLATGRYVLDVEVTDGAGNTTDHFANGQNRVKFKVV